VAYTADSATSSSATTAGTSVFDFNVASNAVDYPKFYSRSHDAVIRIYDEAGKVIETHEHKGAFNEW
jgi:hypothetical protein